MTKESKINPYKKLSIIESLYAEMQERHMPDPSVKFSANTSADNLMLIDAIAKFFQTTRTRLVESLLEESMIPLVMSLDLADRKTIFEVIEAETKEALSKETGTTIDSTMGVTKWGAYLTYINRDEGAQDA